MGSHSVGARPQRPRVESAHRLLTLDDVRDPSALPPVLRIAVERVRSGSRPGERDDGLHLALAVEGGGMRGVVSGGMCVALDQLGLIDGFDSVYGVSAGGVNAIYTAAGQASFGSTVYSDHMWKRQFINPVRAFRGEALFSLHFLLVEVGQGLKPLDEEAALRGPIRPVFLATHVDSGRAVSFRDWETPEGMWRSLWASCSFPGVTGDPVVIDGETYVDGTMSESIPFRTALAEGATHVLVLHSRDRDTVKRAPGPVRRKLAAAVLARYGPRIAELEANRGLRYNADLHLLREMSQDPDANVFSIDPLPEAFLPAQLDNRRASIVRGLRAGAEAAFAALVDRPTTITEIPRGYREPRA